MFDKEDARKAIAELAERFEAQASAYESAGYLESQLRTDFIDEFFKALGWDLVNKNKLSPRQREVLVEKGDTKGRPDYSFRINGEDRFFIEAKAPSKGTDKPDDIFQAKRYGWNTRKVNVVVLTDFKTFRVFDTSLKPDVKQPKLGLLFDIAFSNFASTEFDKIWLFSREQVYAGSLDRLSSKDPSAKRLRIPVDDAFLEQMTTWREKLAKDVYKNNAEITVRTLNDVVQRLLDRLVFIRILEDRKIIESKTLKEIAENWAASKHRDLQSQMNALFKQLNNDFNGEIFKEHPCETIAYDSGVVAEIIDELYYPKSPYDFAVIGVELLGIIYEKYLGKTIRLTEKRVKVEEKPEVRKAGGVYYTPKWVVHYIVENTVGKLVENKKPEEIAKFHVLDPACGSGSFLLGALEKLFDVHLDYYSKNPKEANRNTLLPNLIVEYDSDGNETHRLSIAKKGEILKNNIYGVDIDPQAVEITMMSLYIKTLEGEKMLPHNKELLPSLSNNVKCGNSLIGFDFSGQKTRVEESEKEKANPFEWASKQTGFGNVLAQGGFDAIIGNPPYIRIQTMNEWAPKDVEYFSRKYKSAESGNYDIYAVFVEKSIELLSDSGAFGFILPHKFFQAEYGKNLRQIIAEKRLLREIVNFTDQQVFEQATTYTCLLFLSKEGKNSFKYSEIRKLNEPVIQLATIQKSKDYSNEALKVGILPITTISEQPWQLGLGDEAKLLDKLKKVKPSLSDICDKIFQGVITGADQVFILEDTHTSDSKKYMALQSKALNKIVKIERDILRPLLKGSLEIRRYKIVKPIKYVIFPYEIDGENVKLLEFKKIEELYPHCAAYLKANKNTLEEREHGKWKCSAWYAYSRNQNLIQCGKKKVLTPSIAKKASFVYDSVGDYYFVGSGGGGGGGYGLSIKPDVKIDPRYLVGLLNSSLLDFMVKKVSTRFSGGFFAYNKQYIQFLPILLPNEKTQENDASQIVNMVDKITALRQDVDSKDPAKREFTEREANVYEEKIDEIVYKLYGLTAEERKIVEGS